MKKINRTLLPIIAVLLTVTTVVPPAVAHAIPQLIFPVIGPSSFINDFDADRGSFGKHRATDIIAKKGQKIVAARSGTVYYVQYPQPSWGYSVGIRDDNGYKYNYLHMNDDNPGTNDGKGGPMRAYAPDMQVGNRVAAGQLLGWVGDSGYSGGVSHLHFEIETAEGTRINPYSYLVNAKRISTPTMIGQLPNELLPYGASSKDGASVAMGNFNLDLASELVTGAGHGGGPHVKVFNANKMLIDDFYAYNPEFRGGVDVATADFDNDGIDEIITAAGRGGGPHVKVFKLDGTEISDFYAYAGTFRDGVNVAAADVDGDGMEEIITGPGQGSGPHVKIFELDGTQIGSFYAYAGDFRGGVDVAAGNVDNSLPAEIVTGAGPGGTAHVRVLNLDGSQVGTFHAYPDTFRGGVRVSVGNVRTGTLSSEILTVPANYGNPTMRMWASDGTRLASASFMEGWWSGYHDVAAGSGTSMASTGINRRTSIRTGLQ